MAAARLSGPGRRDPSLIAGVLYRDFARARDDVTVLAARAAGPRPPRMKTPILTVQIRFEQDVVLTRQRARQIAALLDFDALDQTRIATAVSEIARNAYQHAGGGKVEFWVEDAAPPLFVIQIRDQGPGLGERQVQLDREDAVRSGASGPASPGRGG